MKELAPMRGATVIPRSGAPYAPNYGPHSQPLPLWHQPAPPFASQIRSTPYGPHAQSYGAMNGHPRTADQCRDKQRRSPQFKRKWRKPAPFPRTHPPHHAPSQ
ncbi:hypothetical protein B0H19DRAFT_657516 [Mycena capillaripes]|nr:hypothetical protein B0H19DRAFT_657516 [Mycena capillaripes]